MAEDDQSLSCAQASGSGTLEDFAALHEHQKVSKQRGGFQQALVTGLEKFSNLRKIHVQHRPVFSTQGEQFFPESCTGPCSIYNMDKRWYGNAIMDDFTHRSRRPYGDCARIDMQWLVEYDINPTGGVRDLQVLMSCLASQKAGCFPYGLELGFPDCSLDAVGRYLSKLADRSAELLTEGLQHVTALQIAPLLTFPEAHCIDGTLPLSARARDGWYDAMQHMKRLSVLKLWCASAEHADTAIKIMESCTFPTLKALHVECHGEWSLVNSHDVLVLQEIEHFSIPITVLMPFLDRHASTLKELDLRSALGVDGTTLVRKLVVLRNQLASLKSRCKGLESVYIREKSTPVATMEVLDSSTGFSMWTYQAMRSLERESELGRLARDLGADAYEVNPRLERRRTLDNGSEQIEEYAPASSCAEIDFSGLPGRLPDSFPEVAALMRKSLTFEYDLGPTIV